MADHDILYDVSDRVARISMNRPQYRNAQSRRMLEEMDDAFTRAVDDPGVRVIVLRGEGDAFSSGHDLGTPEEQADTAPSPFSGDDMAQRFRLSLDLFVDRTLRWRNLPKPTIAAVQGYCIYGGWMIASAMDVIFAAESAQFLGVQFQYFSIPWDIGVRRTKELLFEGRFIDAREAKRLGLVNRVLPDANLDEETMAYARRIAENDPARLRTLKFAANQVQDTQGFAAHIQAVHAMNNPPQSAAGSASGPSDAIQRARENQRITRTLQDRGEGTEAD